MASGLPVGSICLTANKEITEMKQRLYCLQKRNEYDSLEKLIIDTNLRSEFGAKGRKC
jgi:hypothetical protein